ncbi:uncharacterized protein LOC122087956 isoform X2 [Macadamia integrifolia]|uniref:uncharacterized protein LOC122087956 isoform X2 n=1 Tax=Macadamia integrifolia TaxID=60698 RepID=UPI001C4F1067|nr:uncharacterized protein LOC122087956 isoform X2 [Macadamia integrifolia]
MQRGNGGRDDFFNFGDPFAGFGGLGGHGSLISNFFGGRDPFDDPFFTRPFGPSMFGPSMFGPSMFGPSMFGPGMFGPRGSIFGDSPASGFIEHEPPQANSLASGFIKHEPPQANKSKGPIIKELNSDDEEVEETEAKEKASEEKKDNPRKHSRSSKDPYVEEPDDEAEGRRSKHMQYMHDYNRADRTQPQARSFTFQSSTVTYGGADGPCYTSSKTRRTGSDGVMIEECKEADTTTSRAAHRLSRGLHDKGHSIMRKLNSDGKVDTMQTLHNLNEDELVGFEDAWRGSARTHLPGWNERLNMHGDIGAISSGQGQATNGGWALPSTEQHKPQGSERRFGGGVRTGTSKGRARPSTRINID